MSIAKPVSPPFTNHFKFSSKQCPGSNKENNEMKSVPYESTVGSLMYAMVCTRPDIAYAVGVVSRYLSNPCQDHWATVKQIFRYLRGISRVLRMENLCSKVLQAGDIDSRKSTSVFLMTFAGEAISWQSR